MLLNIIKDLYEYVCETCSNQWIWEFEFRIRQNYWHHSRSLRGRLYFMGMHHRSSKIYRVNWSKRQIHSRYWVWTGSFGYKGTQIRCYLCYVSGFQQRNILNDLETPIRSKLDPRGAWFCTWRLGRLVTHDPTVRHSLSLGGYISRRELRKINYLFIGRSQASRKMLHD